MFKIIRRKKNKGVTIEDRVPQTLKKELQKEFASHINQSKPDFEVYFATYFSYTVLVKGENILAEKPVDLDSYKTIEALAKERTLVKYLDPVKTNNSQEEVLEIITWDKHFQEFIQSYVEEQFNGMFLSESKEIPSKIKKYLYPDEYTDTALVQQIVDALTRTMGLTFFAGVVEDLKSLVYANNPREVYTAGEASAKSLIKDAQNHLKELDANFLELAESITRTNRLWEKVKQNYKATFQEDLPKGKIDQKVYYEKYMLALQNLKLDKVPVEAIRELAVLDTKFDPDVLTSIANFNYL